MLWFVQVILLTHTIQEKIMNDAIVSIKACLQSENWGAAAVQDRAHLKRTIVLIQACLN